MKVCVMASAIATNDHKRSTPLRILVVEDHVDTARATAKLLRYQGHQVQVATDGQDALATAAAAPPDVVLLDLDLPEMSGWEVARRLRDQAVGRRPLLVAISGLGDSEYRRLTHEAGIDLHLLKPADPQQLFALLERFARLLTHP
jgi:two-component system, OmpR family, response regulator